jgi:hypothetical protein
MSFWSSKVIFFNIKFKEITRGAETNLIGGNQELLGSYWSTITQQASNNWQHLSILWFGRTLCIPIFAKRSNINYCKRSHYVRGSKSIKLAKEITNIYCQIFINYYYYLLPSGFLKIK